MWIEIERDWRVTMVDEIAEVCLLFPDTGWIGAWCHVCMIHVCMCTCVFVRERHIWHDCWQVMSGMVVPDKRRRYPKTERLIPKCVCECVSLSLPYINLPTLSVTRVIGLIRVWWENTGLIIKRHTKPNPPSPDRLRQRDREREVGREGMKTIIAANDR